MKDQLPPGLEPDDGPDLHRPRRNLHVQRRGRARRANRTGSRYTPTDLRTIQDWIIKPQLRTVPGVVEVNSIGGYERQFHVLPDPAKLMAYRLTFRDVMTALAAQQRQCRRGLYRAQRRAISGPDAGPGGRHRRHPRRRDRRARRRAGPHLAMSPTCAIGQELRTGAATDNGEEVVIGTAIMLIGENSRSCRQRVAAKLDDVNRTLPEGVVARDRLRPHLSRRSHDRTRSRKICSKARCWSIVILFLLLGNFRARHHRPRSSSRCRC